MPPATPKIITCTEAHDVEGVKKCIEEGCNIDEQRQVALLAVVLFKGWKICVVSSVSERFL